MTHSTEVLVIGGGVTGCGVLFDLAQRGFRCLLVERGALSNGTSGRFHGLLHSGGRYTVRDPVAARECIQENAILRRIMPHAVEDTGGLFVATPWDPPEYADGFPGACRAAGIPVEEITPAEALRREPLLNPALARAFAVPDGSVETWEACRSLVESAAEYGAETWVYHEVVDLLRDNGRVRGARVQDVLTGEERAVECDMVVNAAGAWGGRIAGMAGCPVTIAAGKGTMIAMNYRMVNTVINRCGPPGDGDILVPVGTVAVMGTTSVDAPDPDAYPIEAWEIRRLLDEGERMVPSFKTFRALRAWAGVRPLYREAGQNLPPQPPSLRGKGESDAPLLAEEGLGESGSPLLAGEGQGEGSTSGQDLRQVTRGYALLDHAVRDGVEGLVTITGGKWTTYRLMAEHTADLVCRKLGTQRPCRTAETALKGHESWGYFHLGGRIAAIEHGERAGEQIVCECELITRPQVEASLAHNPRPILNDLRRDLRLGMGPCQGGFCAYRAAGLLHEREQLQTGQASPTRGSNPAPAAGKALVDFLQERWKGILPVLWGQSLRQVQLDEGIYLGLLGLDKLPAKLSGAGRPRLGELETEGYFEVGSGE
jgi:glycerol-3-phosphate dehydrogenase